MTRNQGKQLFCLCFPFGLFRKFQIVKLSERSSCDVNMRQEQGRALDVLPTCSDWEQRAPARAQPQPFGGFSGLKVPGNSETTAARIVPAQTIQVLAQVSGFRCMNSFVDSKDTSHAFRIRYVLVPVAKGCQKPTSAVTPCYICL